MERDRDPRNSKDHTPQRENAEHRSIPVTTLVTDTAEPSYLLAGRVGTAVNRMLPSATQEGKKIAIYHPKLNKNDAIATRTAELVNAGRAFLEAEVQAYYEVRHLGGRKDASEEVDIPELQAKEISAQLTFPRKDDLQALALVNELDQLTREHPGVFVLVPEIIPDEVIKQHDSEGRVPPRPDLQRPARDEDHLQVINRYAKMERLKNEQSFAQMEELLGRDDVVGGVSIVSLHRGLLSTDFAGVKQADGRTNTYDTTYSYPDPIEGEKDYFPDVIDTLVIKAYKGELTTTDIEIAKGVLAVTPARSLPPQISRKIQHAMLENEHEIAKRAERDMEVDDYLLDVQNLAEALDVSVDTESPEDRLNRMTAEYLRIRNPDGSTQEQIDAVKHVLPIAEKLAQHEAHWKQIIQQLADTFTSQQPIVDMDKKKMEDEAKRYAEGIVMNMVTELTGVEITRPKQISEEIFLSVERDSIGLAGRALDAQERFPDIKMGEITTVWLNSAAEVGEIPGIEGGVYNHSDQKLFELNNTVADLTDLYFGNDSESEIDENRYIKHQIIHDQLASMQFAIDKEIAKLNGQYMDSIENPTDEERQHALASARAEVRSIFTEITGQEIPDHNAIAEAVIRATAGDAEGVKLKLGMYAVKPDSTIAVEDVEQSLAYITGEQEPENIEEIKEMAAYASNYDLVYGEERDLDTAEHERAPLAEREEEIWTNTVQELGALAESDEVSGAFVLGEDGIDDHAGQAEDFERWPDFYVEPDTDDRTATEIDMVSDEGIKPVFEDDRTDDQRDDRDTRDEGRD
jgi:hypothetical protein